MSQHLAGDIVAALLYLIGNSVSLFAFHIIRSYQKFKPLGLQTILSKAIIVFSYISTLASSGTCLVVQFSLLHNHFYGPLNHGLGSLASALVLNFSSMTFFALGFVLAVKYLLIYHRYKTITKGSQYVSH